MTVDCIVISPTDRHAAVIGHLYAAMLTLDGRTADAEASGLHANRITEFHAEAGIQTAGLRAASLAVALLAETVGAVITIDQVPLLPLAMGHYEHRVSVREKRAAA